MSIWFLAYQTLSKALEMYKKVPLTSSGGLQSKDLYFLSLNFQIFLVLILSTSEG